MNLIKSFFASLVLFLSFFIAQSTSAVTYTFGLPVNPTTPTGTLSAVNCTIVTYGGTTCNSPINWTTNNTYPNSLIRVYNASTYTNPGYPDTATQQSQYVVGTNNPNTTTNPNLNSGTLVTGVIPYGTSTLELYDIRSNVANQPNPNNNQWYLYKIATTTVTASCGPNMTWNGTGCFNTQITATIASDPTCTISANASTCNVNVSWTSNNYYYASVKQDGTQFSTALTQPTAVVRPISNGSHTFTYYGGITPTTLFASSTSVASCISGTTWNGSICALPPAITSDATCTIYLNMSTCPVNVTWSSTNLVSPSIKQDGTQFATNANQTTPVSRSITYGAHSFTISDGSTLLATSTSTGVCVSGTGWYNGTSCTYPPTGGIASDVMCSIPANANTCNVGVTWFSSNASNPIVKQDGTTFSNLANQSSILPRNIAYGTHTFDLYNGSNLLGTSPSDAWCMSGTVWNGTVCDLLPSSGTIFSDASCIILQGFSDCSVGVIWSSTNLASPSIELDSVQFSTSPNEPIPQMINIPYGLHNFTLNDGTTLIDTSTSKGICDTGTVWNGTICDIPPTGTITSDQTCAIPLFGNSCSVNVSWNSSNTVSPSVEQDTIPFSNLANQLTSIPRTISRGVHNFTLKDGSTVLSNSTSTADCTGTLAFNGSPIYWSGAPGYNICTANLGNNIILYEGQLPYNALNNTPLSCTIPLNGSTCNISVVWVSPPSVSSPIMKKNGIAFSNINYVTWPGSTQSISYGPTTFSLYDGAIPLASSSVDGVCAPGLSWNGTVCQ